MTWDVARDSCQLNAPNDSGDLASVTNTDIQEFISNLGDKFFIGGQTLNGPGTWSWSDGSDWNYENWKGGEPSGNKVVQRIKVNAGFNHQWNDVSTTGPYSMDNYLCQYFVRGNCRTGWRFFAGKCYKKYEESRTWDDARAVCQNDAPKDSYGDLASVASNAKQLFLVSLIQTGDRVWIGGIKVAGQSVWEWSDGSSWDYDNWEAGPGQSNIADGMRCDPKKDDLSCCSDASPCGIGEGDCDSDSECAGDLRCGDGNCPAPAASYIDCCSADGMRCDPKNDDLSCCSDASPCGIGEGDCDRDSECGGDLRCGDGNCPAPAWHGMDCCSAGDLVIEIIQEKNCQWNEAPYLAERDSFICQYDL